MRESEVEFGALLDRLRDHPSYEATSLIAIDGLSLHGGDVVINETMRLRTLDREDLNEFFENPQVAAFDAGLDIGPLEGRAFVQRHHSKDSEGAAFFDFSPNDYAEPWLSYINLFGDQTVHTGERFFKYNSMRRFLIL